MWFLPLALPAVPLEKPPGNLENPIVRGFAPDPSVCRVGKDFYLVNSSFEYFPGVPIRHSTDLSNWTLIGHCLTRPSQLPLDGQPSSAGIYATTLRYHDGVFYMVTTNVGAGGNFFVTATRIEGPWSEPVKIPVQSIDPSLFWDEDGTCYLTVQGDQGIRQAKFDPKTGKLLSALKVIWTGTGGQYPEGPHLFKHNGVYFLTIAEGGTEYGHMQTLARSKSPWGPFESCPFNPILTHRSIRSPFQAIGHADFFDDGKGAWWAACLGIRPQGYPYAHCLGRETFLVPVQWGADGWPHLGDDGRVPETLDLLASANVDAEETTDFEGGKIPLTWDYLRNPDASAYRADPAGGLRLMARPIFLDTPHSPTWIGRPQTHFNSEFRVDCEPRLEGDGEAGISIRMNDRHRIELFRRGGEVCMRATIGPLSQIVKSEPVTPGPCTLIVRTYPDRYAMSCISAGNTLDLGSIESRYLSTEVAGGFTGVMLGVYAYDKNARGYLRVIRATYKPLGDRT